MVKRTLPLLLTVAVTATVAQGQTASAAPKAVPVPSESATLAKIRPSIATLADAGRFLGTAVLIGEDGRFLAHRSALRGIGPDGIIATLSDGTKVRLFIDARDTATQFVLLQARPWAGGIAPVKTVTGAPAPGTPLVAVLGPNVFRAQVSPRERIGIDKNTSRMLPLTELTFENTNGIVGGSALFTPAGEFFGYVTAVLTPGEALGSTARNVGPANLVIGYSMAPDVTRRAVEGFLSPSKRPQVASV
ncbi:serine protease, partial [bacterium]